MSVVGAYEFSKKGDWKIFPSKITVHIHDTIETRGLGKNDVEALMNRVHAIVAKPVDEYYGVQTDSASTTSARPPSRTQAAS